MIRFTCVQCEDDGYEKSIARIKRVDFICEYCRQDNRKKKFFHNKEVFGDKKKCKLCKKSFKSWGANKDRQVFCSDECRVEFNKPKKKVKINKECLECGKKFLTFNGLWCSQNCRNKVNQRKRKELKNK